ncbi:hypothetical protein ACFFLM_11945 [Deinococcus oregonensis]|uniref:Bacteriocin immunity protein n=1 Tax=Deinococcus oregonensis TaxID=1805970 RepID=A0ABV6AZ14_9DEIO
MKFEDKLARLLEIRRKILSTGGEEDEQLLTELESISNHPAPLDILMDVDQYSSEEFSELMFNYQPTILPFDNS